MTNAHKDAELLELGRMLEVAWKAELPLLRQVESSPEVSPSAWEAAHEATRQIVDKIEKLSACTLEGLKIKVRAYHWCRGEDPLFDSIDLQSTDMRLLKSLIEDIEHLDAQAA